MLSSIFSAKDFFSGDVPVLHCVPITYSKPTFHNLPTLWLLFFQRTYLKFYSRFESKLKLIPENCIRSYENWIKEASVTFHQNHYLIIGVKYTLSLLYGKTNGFMLPDLSHDLLQRKIVICEELLEVAKIIQPGLSRLRGN